MADEQRVGHLIDDLVAAIAHDMAAARAAGDASRWAVIGIRSRGDVLAKRIAQRIKFDQVGTLDITLYRDDLSEVAAQPVVRPTEIPFALDGLNVVLIDDVLMTGRSVRAALQLLMDLGRPRRVWLAVLVDRGQRELPIAPDHVALDLSGSARSRHIAPGLPGGTARDHVGETARNPAQVPGYVAAPAQVPGYMVGRGGGTLADAVKPDERVAVHLKPTDEEDAIIVTSRAAKGAGAA